MYSFKCPAGGTPPPLEEIDKPGNHGAVVWSLGKIKPAIIISVITLVKKINMKQEDTK